MEAASFALVLSLPVLFAPLLFPSSPPEGRERGRGGQDVRPSRRCPAAGRSAARCGDVVAIASTRSGRGGRPSLSLSADTSGRSGEVLAMVWTVETSDGAEEAMNWQRWRRHPSPWFSLFLFCSLLCSSLHHNLKDETRKRTRREGWQTVEALPFPSACFCFSSIYNNVYITKIRQLIK